MRKSFPILLAVLLGSALATGTALAAERITISPTSTELETSAGSTYSGTVKIVDSGTTDYAFQVYSSPYWVHGEDYAQSFILEPDKVDASKWFKFDQTVYQAKAHQDIVVPYRLQVPSGAGPGGYYVVVFAQTQNPGGGATIKSKIQVGTIFYITVRGSVDQRGNVETFSVPAIQTSPPLQSTLRMKNTGNTHFDADINIEIKDVFGNTKAILPATHIILPETIRRIPITWDKAPGYGLFRVEGTVKYNGKTEKLPTRYTLMLSSGGFVVMFLVALALVAYAILTRKRRGNVRRG